MSQIPAPEKSEETEIRHLAPSGQTYKIACPPQSPKVNYAGRSAAQGLVAAYKFADASRRDADRD